ncbi:450_t:CDS:2 [Funneliformis geosporum]|uniref:450_t:CDS:1 n=1 Tax=Funneliformis geosporum TaxID=1117311 RepID=A0A9W4SXH1_9GLOM|nr:450_t:CDS:2 [Funneliformis geosporum]
MTSSSLSVDISSLSYMDDVNWIASSKEDLEFILDIADEYYSLIRLKFGLFHIPIIPVLGSVRFLDILINIFNSSSFVKKQTKDTISSFITTLKSKLLTDKQLIYFFNTVLMLTLEYSLQIIPLSFNECNTLSAPIQRLLKSNSKFASSAPDCLFKENNFYNLHDLWNQLMQEFSTAFLIRLFRLQLNNRLHVSPLVKWDLPFNNKSFNNFIGAIFSFLKQNGLEISFNIHKYLKNEIKGGLISLDSILPQAILVKHQYIINKFSLLFLDQFLDNKGSSFINWKELVNRSCYKNNFFKKNNVSNFYKLVSSLVLKSDSSRLVSQNYRLARTNIFL